MVELKDIIELAIENLVKLQVVGTLRVKPLKNEQFA